MEVAVLGRVLLVIEVVEEPDDPPPLDLRGIRDAEPLRVGAHGFFDGPPVTPQGIPLSELEEKVLRLLPRGPAAVGLRHVRILPTGRNGSVEVVNGGPTR